AEAGRQADRIKLRDITRVARRGLVRGVQHVLVHVVQGKEAGVAQIFQRVPVHRRRAADKGQQRRVGAEVYHRTDQCQVGLAAATDGADQVGALETGQAIYERGALPFRQVRNIVGLQQHDRTPV